MPIFSSEEWQNVEKLWDELVDADAEQEPRGLRISRSRTRIWPRGWVGCSGRASTWVGRSTARFGRRLPTSCPNRF